MMALSGRQAQFLGGVIVLMVILATGYACTRSTRDGLQPFEVVVVNDSPGTVRLRMCQFNDCGDDREIVTLGAGRKTAIPSLNDSNPRPWKIVDAEGRTIGCFPFFFSTSPPDEHAVVAVSDSVPCGSDLGASAVTGPDWPANE